ncbi:enoyl-CoA hydratase-related protein [uncultured Alsobacter sp.]|uniref:enoyl-CoA hydratase-related protein n=1 Tax=uncultured Alsobacter sp. TaxID=1748258 RepID=UPI0025DE1639|nr:enoyl-CoA hydratase-related protein [uncultured Alsobacter sp.]
MASAGGSDTHVRIEDRDGVRHVVLDRPAKKNAITRAMYSAAADAFEAAASDDAIGAVLLRGEGGCFTAGNDLADFLEGPPPDDGVPVVRFLDAVAACPKPVVAAVEGLAIGIGTTILLHCDLVFAAPDARLRTPFADLGLVPEAASSVLLPRRVGQARAARLLLAGEMIDGTTAEAWGLVGQLVPAADLVPAATAAAAALAAKPRKAMLASKALMRPDVAEVLAVMRREFAAFREGLRSEEAKAAFAAFLSRGKA